jgi:serine/threonine protein kinase
MIGGTLLDALVKKGRFTEEKVLDVLTEMSLTLRKLKICKISHRDIKAENVLLHDGELKLSDFGLARVLVDSKILASTKVGTSAYLSPEMYKGQPTSFPTDMWSLGVTVYLLLTNKFPFGDPRDQETYNSRLVKGNYDAIVGDVSQATKDIFKGMFVVDPAKRLTVDQLLEHPLVSPRIKKFRTPDELVAELFIKPIDNLYEEVHGIKPQKPQKNADKDDRAFEI